MRTQFLIIVIILASVTLSKGQDPQFSQFYAAPTYLNPALAGAGLGARFVTNFRAQWPALPGSFSTLAASYDQDLPNINSGIGIRFASDQAGAGSFTSNTVALQYCYVIALSRKLRLRTGMDIGYVSRSVSFEQLTFPDQLSLTGLSSNPTAEVNNFGNVNYLDLGTGAVLYTKKYWLGLAVQHLNRPDQGNREGISSELPAKVSLHGGMKIDISSPYQPRADERVRALQPAFVYKRQGDFSQLDLGMYLNYEPMVFGIWYRGLPVGKAVDLGYFNQDALIFLIGLKEKNYSIGYSYDVTLGQLAGSTGGSHEFSLTLEFETPTQKSHRYKVKIPCPKF